MMSPRRAVIAVTAVAMVALLGSCSTAKDPSTPPAAVAVATPTPTPTPTPSWASPACQGLATDGASFEASGYTTEDEDGETVDVTWPQMQDHIKAYCPELVDSLTKARDSSICRELASTAKENEWSKADSAEYLIGEWDDSYGTEKQRTAAVREAASNACPKWVKPVEDGVKKHEAVLKEAADWEAAVESGRAIEYDTVRVVGNEDWELKAGTWRTTKPDTLQEGCYWERADKAGNIIANNFGTIRSVTVHLRNGETFTTNDCGSWERIGG